MEAQNNMNSVTVSATPVEGQKVLHEGKLFTTIKEGLAYILVPNGAPLALDPKVVKNGLIESQAVFYNPIQQFNRDLSVLAIKAYGDDMIANRRARTEAKHKNQNKGLKEKRGVKRKANGEELIDTADDNATTMASNGTGQSIDTDNITAITGEGAAVSPPAAAATTVSPDNDVTMAQTEIHEIDGGVQTTNRPINKESFVLHNDNSKTTSQDNKSSFKTKFRILDALSATGLRALRYAQEIPSATSITANDLSAQATASIKVNVEFNKLGHKIKTITGNALSHMYGFVTQSGEGTVKNESRYDVIDLDPYGTAVPFLDAAVQALSDGGLLCVTCTDAGVFASCGYPEKTYSLYGGTPIKGLHSHEGGLRLILHAIATSAARHGMSIEPLLSLSIDFYARVFVRLHRSPAEVKMLAGKTMLVYSCDSGCGAWQTQFMARNLTIMGKDGKTPFTKHGLAQGPSANIFCEHCGFKQHLSGPMYGGPLHNPNFIQSILNYLPDLDKTTYMTTARIEGMLSTALEETLLDDDIDGALADPVIESTSRRDAQACRPVPRADASKVDKHPFFFNVSALAKVLHCSSPAEAAIKGALRHSGYRATRSHCKPGTIRTDASWTFLWEMMREWIRQRAPVRQGVIKEGTPGWKIMGEEIRNFEQAQGDGKTLKGAESGLGRVKNIEHNGAQGGVDKPTPEQSQSGKRKIVFDEKLGREGNTKRLVRYQENPRANWGPMNRAKAKGKGCQNNDKGDGGVDGDNNDGEGVVRGT